MSNTPISATFPSGSTRRYNSVNKLAKVLSGTGTPSGGLRASIARNAYHGSRVRGVRVKYI